MKMRWLVAGAFAATGVISGCGGGGGGAPAVSFVADVKPILEGRCLGCHNSETLLGRFNLEKKELAFGDPDGRIFIDPGNAQGSKVYIALTLPRDDEAAMPPEGHQVPEADVEVVRRWIDQGAEWPDGEDGRLVRASPE